MITLRLVLLLLAVVCFGAAAANVAARINFTGLGLALCVLAMLLPTVP